MKRETLIWTVLLVAAGGFLLYRSATVGVGTAYVQQLDDHWTGTNSIDAEIGVAQLSWPRTIGVWIAALFTLGILSFLYRDNPLYRVCESVVVGVSAAYWMVIGFWTVIVPNLLGKIWPAQVQSWAMPGLSPVREAHWYVNLIPLMLGIMLLWRLAPRGAWIGRWPLAFVIGTTAGIRMMGFIEADFLSQIRAGIEPVVVFDSAGEFAFWDTVTSTIMLLSVLACLVYFFFSFEHKGIVGRISRVGIWVLMITFGAAFGYTVMGRVALLAIRLEFLFNDWLKIM